MTPAAYLTVKPYPVPTYLPKEIVHTHLLDGWKENRNPDDLDDEMIVDAMQGFDKPCSPAEVAEIVGFHPHVVRARMIKLVEDERLYKVGKPKKYRYGVVR
jgi:hypothetical protein